MAIIEKAIPMGYASINFRVKSGTTRPDTAVENTIWITSDLSIGEWQMGYVQPTTRSDGTSLVAGDVWIQIDDKRVVSLNLLKLGGGITVTIGQAKQYDGSDWVVADGSIYQNGEWKAIDNRYYLVYEGECVHISSDAWSKTITYGDGYIEWAFTSSTQNVNNTTAFDATNYTKICWDIISHSKPAVGISYGTTDTSTGTYTHRVLVDADNGDVIPNVFTADLSTIKGMRYLTARGGDSQVVQIRSIWLE